METVIQNIWFKSKLLIKGLIIGLLVLILQIPTYYVSDLIQERETRQKEAIADVSSKWAGRQNIAGPVLVLPYLQSDSDPASKVKSRHYAYFLPDVMNITANVQPQEKYRGIYKVMLYSSKVNLQGSFGEIHPEKLKVPLEDILWNEAFVQLNISDAKGLNEEPIVKWNNKSLNLSTQSIDGALGNNSLSTPIGATTADDFKNIHFSTDVNLSGSEQLLFTPVGKTTTVVLNSKWPHPSFTGDALPQSTQINDSGFSAIWKSLAHTRSFPQEWKDNNFILDNKLTADNKNNNISAAAFGADLFVPVNGYQKTLRSVKYSVLCILLTFASFFLIEVNQKKSLHPFQYGLIGLALVLFYTLLLSFSEYIGFDASYAVASIATIGMIAWFANGILNSFRSATILSIVLLLLYTYVFTILQLQDYSLLLGSIGLFLTLGIIMHFSKRIQW
jgi:inner membrane protein